MATSQGGSAPALLLCKDDEESRWETGARELVPSESDGRFFLHINICHTALLLMEWSESALERAVTRYLAQFRIVIPCNSDTYASTI